MKTKQKIKDFFLNLKTNITNLKANKTVLICAFLTLIYLISGYCRWIEIAVSVCALVFMTILPLQNAFCIFMFLHSFTLSNIGYDSCYMVTQIGFCLILLIKYILGLKKGHYQFHRKIVLAIGWFIAISVTISLFKPLYRGAWMYFIYFALIYLFFAMRKEFKISQGMNYMFGGLITSCAAAAISIFFPHFQYQVLNGSRFLAFFNCTNYLYMRAMFVLAYFMYRNLNKNLSHWKFAIVYALCAVFTLTTLSKTGIAMLALFTLIYLVLFLKQDFKKRIKFVGVLLVFVAILCLACHKLIISVWDRFAKSFESNDFWGALLTGRDLIWELYIKAIFKNPFTALFGHGMLHEQIFIASIFGPTETHNFYLFLLYRFGIVGTIALGYIIYLILKEMGYIKPKLIAWLPLIFILLESLCDNTHRCYNFTYFIFAIMILFMSQKENEHSNNEAPIKHCKQNPQIETEIKKD